MSFWKWFLCLSFVVVVGSENSFEENKIIEKASVHFLPYFNGELPGLKKLAARLSAANDKEQVAVLNEYADELLTNLNGFMASNNLSQVPIPGFEESFKWTIFSGWILCEDGWMRGLNSLIRRGDVEVRYVYPHLQVNMILGFEKLTFDYHYEAKYMGMGPDGTMEGKSKNSKFTLDLTLHMVNLRANMDKFKLNSIGSISLKFKGSIVGSLVNILVAVVTPIVRPIITIVMNAFIVDGVAAMFDVYNGLICKLLGDCPPVEPFIAIF